MTAQRRGAWPLVVGTLLVLAIAYGLWAPRGLSRVLPAGSNGCQTHVSPKGWYRVEECRPAWPYLSLTKDLPRFVRFYDHRTGRLLGESRIIESANAGGVQWPIATVPKIQFAGGVDGAEVPAAPEP